MPPTDDDTDAPVGTPPPDVTIDAPPEGAATTLASTQAAEVRAQRVEASQSAIGRLVAGDVRASESALGLVRGRSVELAGGAAGAVAADRVTTRGGVALLVVARHVSGDVKVLLDWRAAAAAVGTALVIGRLLRGRR